MDRKAFGERVSGRGIKDFGSALLRSGGGGGGIVKSVAQFREGILAYWLSQSSFDA